MSSATHNGKRSHLTTYIVIAIVAAILLAVFAPRPASMLEVGGQIFLRLLQMVVVPLVMASVMSGILGLGDIRKLGRPGGYAILYYLTTTVLAVVTGLAVVNLVNPGVGINRELVEDAQQEGAETVEEAHTARRDVGKSVTWPRPLEQDRVQLQRKRSSGESNEVVVPTGRVMVLTLEIEQVGIASVPARAQVLVLEEGADELRVLQWEEDGASVDTFTAGSEPEIYSKTVALPPDAQKLQIRYTAQEGGASSAITADLHPGPPTIGEIFTGLVLKLFTNNLLQSMVEMDLLPIIIFSLVFAGMLTTMGRRSEAIATLVMSINDALLNFILLLMKVAPLGIFCLVAARFGKAQLEGQFVDLLQVQAKYMVTVLTGLAIHAFVTLPLIFWIFLRRNPYRFMVQMSQALLTAFSTSSSTATLPVTMETAETKAGVSKRSADFVLPLGATVNMDGTALYEAAAAIFIAQAYAVVDPSFSLTFTQQATIAVTATLAAIGAAGIPEAGLVTMLIVLNAVQLPLELIGLVLPVDWLLDRFRTAVNTFGDSVGAAVVDQTFPLESAQPPFSEPSPPTPKPEMP